MTELLQTEPRAIRVPGHGGVEINVWDHGGDGPPLVVTHCTGTHARIWDPLISVLTPRFRVVALDTRGHGDSDQPTDPEAYDWRYFGDDLIASLAALGLGDGLLALGHSAGASQIYFAELEQPGLFSKAVLIDPVLFPKENYAAENPLEGSARRRRNDFESREAAHARYASKPPMGTWHPLVLDAYIQHAFRELDDGAVTLKCPGPIEAEVYAHSKSDWAFERLGEIETDILLITAEHSDLRHAANLQHAELPQSKLHEIMDAGHFVPQEKPDDVTEQVLKHLA